MTIWAWRSETLFEVGGRGVGGRGVGGAGGVEVARVQGGELVVGAVRDLAGASAGERRLGLEVQRRPRFSLSGERVAPGTGVSAGESFSLVQPGFSVSKLVGECAGKSYLLQRVSPLRKERSIVFEGRTVARVLPGLRELEIRDVDSDVSLVDLAFLTWGCVLVDMPHREMRI